MNYKKIPNSIGVIGRFAPPHLGTQQLLMYAFSYHDYVRIGIGSANRGTPVHPYSARTPFSVSQSQDMLEVLISEGVENNHFPKKPYDFVHLDDHFGKLNVQGKNIWAISVADTFSDIEHILTGNPYVGKLLEDYFTIVDPFAHLQMSGEVRAAKIRYAMAQNTNWQKLVTPSVAEYISQNKLDTYIRNTFGEELLAQVPKDADSITDEQKNVCNLVRQRYSI